MAKGFFTQGMSLLTNGQTTLDNVGSALFQQGFDIVKELPDQHNGAFASPTLVIAFLPDVNGYAAVDVVNQPWPDTMGGPKSDVETFAAWSMGWFGPFAYPGGLAGGNTHGPGNRTGPSPKPTVALFGSAQATCSVATKTYDFSLRTTILSRR